MTKFKLMAQAYNLLRGERSQLEHEIGELKKALKKSNKRKIKCKDFTLFIDDSSRTTLPREAVIARLGLEWVRAHERTIKFRSLRIVRHK